MENSIKAYKGFDEGLICRGYSFEVGQTFKHDGLVKVCESGFHACTNPFDVWDYYNIAESTFADVTLSGVAADQDQSDSKIVGAQITIDVELSLGEFVGRCCYWLLDKTKSDWSQLAASGSGSKLAASGSGSKLAASGNWSQLAASGDWSQLAASGDWSQLAASGDRSQLAASGDRSKLAASGDDGVISSSGGSTVAKGGSGTWISLAEFVDGKCMGFATGCIGHDGLKPNVFYKAKNGKLVEVA